MKHRTIHFGKPGPIAEVRENPFFRIGIRNVVVMGQCRGVFERRRGTVVRRRGSYMIGYPAVKRYG